MDISTDSKSPRNPLGWQTFSGAWASSLAIALLALTLAAPARSQDPPPTPKEIAKAAREAREHKANSTANPKIITNDNLVVAQSSVPSASPVSPVSMYSFYWPLGFSRTCRTSGISENTDIERNNYLGMIIQACTLTGVSAVSDCTVSGDKMVSYTLDFLPIMGDDEIPVETTSNTPTISSTSTVSASPTFGTVSSTTGTPTLTASSTLTSTASKTGSSTTTPTATVTETRAYGGTFSMTPTASVTGFITATPSPTKYFDPFQEQISTDGSIHSKFINIPFNQKVAFEDFKASMADGYFYNDEVNGGDLNVVTASPVTMVRIVHFGYHGVISGNWYLLP